MNRKYNFHQSQGLLKVDPKTFGRWLEKAHIDPKKQINRADPRQKWLTEEQIIMLARDHDRPPPSFPKEDEPETPGVTLASVAEQLAEIEQLITQCFTDLRHDLANLERRITFITQADQAEEKSPETPTAPVLLPLARPSPTRAQGKQKGKSKQLPSGYIPLRVFAMLHGISTSAADRARESGKIPTKHGYWLYKSRYVTEALDAQGRHEFYALFSERESFQACKSCPHATKVG